MGAGYLGGDMSEKHTPDMKDVYRCQGCGAAVMTEAVVLEWEDVGALVEAARMLYAETIDYITINHLGDPHHNQSMKQMKAALAPFRSGK